MNLETSEVKESRELNSINVESCHSLSYDGKWIAYTSRRTKESFSQLYIAHFDAKTGEFGKHFVSKIERIEGYFEELYSYNIPEFIID